MHWVGAQDGMLDAERELILSQQTPADVVFLSAADTDLAAAAAQWSVRFGGRLRLSHAAPLRQPVAADHFVETVLRGSRLLVARLLGGRAYFPHLLQALGDLRDCSPRPKLLLLSATEAMDGDLAGLSDFPADVATTLHRLFTEGGALNLQAAGALLESLLEWSEPGLPPLPAVVPVPAFGWYKQATTPGRSGTVWLTFYRAWEQTSDLEIVDALSESLEKRGLAVGAFFCQSLREPAVQAALLAQSRGVAPPDAVLTLQSFSASHAGSDASAFLRALDCPVLQVAVSANGRALWERNPAGLAPGEAAIQAALPELDGRVFATVAGFKEEATLLTDSQCTLKKLRPDHAQIEQLSALTGRWVRLRKLEPNNKRVAIVLSNYPNRDGRVGNGVGLDTPASALALLRALAAAGYAVEHIPADSDALMRLLLLGVTNDPEGSYGKTAAQSVPRETLEALLNVWPAQRAQELRSAWNDELPDHLPVAGVRLGNVFLGIQPARGFSQQTQAIYHSPDLPPPPSYIAFYHWLREEFQADVIVHLGKHGNLEWLPGRALALGTDDYPRLCIGAVPHFYPFIVNNPGEGTQAKRRTHAVIVDHLTPPLTRAGLYGKMEPLERLLEEHTHCVALYPRRAAELEAEMEALLAEAPWRADLPSQELSALANFLCELKESQIRSGLHILGSPPEGEQQVDFLLSLLRLSSGGRVGLFEAIQGVPVVLETLPPAARDALDRQARDWIANALVEGSAPAEHDALASLRTFLRESLAPLLARTTEEMDHLLHGLAGGFVPPGAAGAPTRGRVDVLPTGRNFYALDPRVVPTPTAWRCGKALGESLLKRHFQDHGEPLRTLALVVWGTSNMRTGGDDLAQALWLWGCEPVWEEASGRVVDFRILPAALLGRPRVDITLRISGLFRDAFGDTVRLLATIPKRLAALDEPDALNPIRAAWKSDRERLLSSGASAESAERTAVLRVFTSGPGSYGTGLLPLLDAGNWETKEDLAAVFVRWGQFAAGADGSLTEEPDALRRRLAQVEAVAQNQDNREHDILDSDDYFQFQGGLHTAVSVLRGTEPANYHGDSANPEVPRIRTLEEEFVRVLHSRALNPRWIGAMQRHGYKGAFEMAATVDYLYGYSATTGIVAGHHFEAVAHALLLDQEAFFRTHNPDALREASAKLLEAAQRGLWTAPDAATLNALETVVLSLEADRE
jgi:cobaltochelatase CobN